MVTRKATGSPQILRAKSNRDEIIVTSPAREVKDQSVSYGRRKETTVGGSTQDSFPHISHAHQEIIDRRVEMDSNLSKGSPASSKVEKSPDIVVDDASVSTSSFDTSIQLLTSSSPNQILLRVMESDE